MIERQNILRGDYADPSILRVEDDYYMVTSAFVYDPSITIWHSKDLFHWKRLCHALEGFHGDIWAIDFIYYKGRYYMYFKAEKTNWVIYSDCVTGPWSTPINLHITGKIDPGHCFDEHGNRYLFFNHGYMIRLASDGLSTLGEIKKVYDGWPIPQDWLVEGFCLEGPKVIRRNGYYYVLWAQGGTAGPATSHMVIVTRSKQIQGPYENAPNNPVIHTKTKEETWWSKGHGSLIDTADGKWYIVYHGYEKGYATLGRQVLISEVVWTEDDWFYVKPIEGATDNVEQEVDDQLSDSFTGSSLSLQWSFFQTQSVNRITFTNTGLVMQGMGMGIEDTSPLLCIPYSHSYEATVKVTLGEGVTAGLTCFYNSHAFCFIGAEKKRITYGSMCKKRSIEPLSEVKDIYLKVQNLENILWFSYSFDGTNYNKTIVNDVSGFNHNTFGGFLSLRLGIFAYGEGHATFKDFVYRHLN